MNIEIIELGTVKIDGAIHGHFAQAVKNNPTKTEELQSALVAYVLTEKQSAETELEVVKADRDRLSTLLAAASAAFDSGDTATMLKLREDSKKTEKQKEIEALQAKLAELTQ
jgi:hypothetical protein